MSLIEFFNDPKSAVIFYAGIGISVTQIGYIFMSGGVLTIFGPFGGPVFSVRVHWRGEASFHHTRHPWLVMAVHR